MNNIPFGGKVDFGQHDDKPNIRWIVIDSSDSNLFTILLKKTQIFRDIRFGGCLK